MTIIEKIELLRKQSKTYRNHDSNKLKLCKIFNKGNGILEFIEVIPKENVILVNKLLAKEKDIERIKEIFDDYKIEYVSLGYPDYYFHTLSSMRN